MTRRLALLAAGIALAALGPAAPGPAAATVGIAADAAAATAPAAATPGAVPAAGAVPHYALDPAKSALEFTFVQAGAQNKGRFKHFTVSFEFAPDKPAGRLEVNVDMPSVDTGDQERDDTVRSDDLFAVKKFPQAQFVATEFARTPTGFEAVGKLTIRGVTREQRVPFTFRTASEGGVAIGYMAGKTSLRRLDFGVGQGDWKATDQVANEVAVAFTLRLTAH